MTLRKSGDLISIKDELEIARLYLEIENYVIMIIYPGNLIWKMH